MIELLITTPSTRGLIKSCKDASSHVPISSQPDVTNFHSKLQRSSLRMKKLLDPKTLSVTLRSGRPFDLSKVVKDLQSIANTLGGAGPAERELKFVVEVVLKEAKISLPKQPKPSLNVEDILEI